MTVVLPTNYFGSSAAAIQLNNGDTRIYYQSANGGIYETGGIGPVATGGKYRDGVQLIPADKVRINTPIAAVTWGGNFNEIRVYYIDQTHHLREYIYDRGSQKWTPGDLNELEYTTAPNSGLLYALAEPFIRVGFQSAAAPGVITEATTATGKWTAGQLA